MNALLVYPDRPFQMGDLTAYAITESGQREKSLISSPADLDREVVCRVSISMSAAEWNDAVRYLPEEHPVRARFGNPDALKREPDNACIREAIGAKIAVAEPN